MFSVISAAVLVGAGIAVCNGSKSQSWAVGPYIWNVFSGQDITTKGGSTGNGAYLTQWPENGSVSQQWSWGRNPS